ncbi:MAG: hypothetical protein KKE62_10200 [Proteobacteria bacterium]|nr:hypothetical protein [Pseudomonadota bacterium]MBU1387501.1 hypothetical protein [Pseudomonadota bacterium]MBU1543198.1 hypothetical protein [Pseudomonadota bacterium]MBU2480277.1 hypothetical protein [Pseudomonadota bacterium]
MAQSTLYNYDVYQQRNPKASAYYKCVENHFEELGRAWDDMYASRYGFWRTYVMTVIYNNLDCGDLYMEFARVRCESGFNVYLCDRIYPFDKTGLGKLARYIICACF